MAKEGCQTNRKERAAMLIFSNILVKTIKFSRLKMPEARLEVLISSFANIPALAWSLMTNPKF